MCPAISSNQQIVRPHYEDSIPFVTRLRTGCDFAQDRLVAPGGLLNQGVVGLHPTSRPQTCAEIFQSRGALQYGQRFSPPVRAQ